MLFNVNDDFLLKSNFDDNLKIEFEWYCFIIFMVLVNGAEGIGIGWSIKFSNYDVREIIVNIKRMLDGEDFFLMVMLKKKYCFIDMVIYLEKLIYREMIIIKDL